MKSYFEFLQELIQKKNDEFTPIERKIADFILQNYKEIPFISIQEFADRLNIGKASIMRFSKKIGFGGYLSLKKDINSRIMSTVAPMEKFRISLDKDVSENLLLNEIGKNEVKNINYMLNNYNPKSYQKAVEMISKANIVYTVGFNLSSFLAEIFSYLLQRIGAKSISATKGGRSPVEQLSNIEKNDVLIAFSLPPYSDETIKAAKYANEHGVDVISFTNSFTSPIVSFSKVVLEVRTESQIFSNSISAISALMYAIVYEVVIKNKSRSLDALDERLKRNY